SVEERAKLVPLKIVHGGQCARDPSVKWKLVSCERDVQSESAVQSDVSLVHRVDAWCHRPRAFAELMSRGARIGYPFADRRRQLGGGVRVVAEQVGAS